MVLVFGGATEGRVAVDVCEQGAGTYYYSTQGVGQVVALHRGIRLTGAMTKDDMVRFCAEHHIRCIVDAAHPFAEGLHKAVAEVGLPVVRVDMRSRTDEEGVIWCEDFTDAVNKLLSKRPKRLLALTGANSVARLAEYWQGGGDTVFRIMRREESIRMATSAGLPVDKLIFYNDEHALPSLEDEVKMMEHIGCDAVITKQSGDMGGFATKVAAARKLGIEVYAVRPPALPEEWTVVTGKHTLRRALEHLVPSFFPLHTGLTTGVCATAAAKAALMSLISPAEQFSLSSVSVCLPGGEEVTVPVTIREKGVAAVVKDVSSDPDVTRGCCIVARVATKAPSSSSSVVRFLQGKGVGRVTLPGLGIAVGEPAINSAPRHMMEKEMHALTNNDVDITIEVEDGEELAKHTFNPRVGVVGGISIIGTTGIVRPMSHEAAVESIGRELAVAAAMGLKEVGMAVGSVGEKFLKEREPQLRTVICGNYIGETLRRAHQAGFRRVVICLGIGKAVKLAEGNMDVHSHKVVMNKSFVKQIALQTAGSQAARKVEQVVMARELWKVMPDAFFEKIKTLCVEHCRKMFPEGELEVVLTKG